MKMADLFITNGIITSEDKERVLQEGPIGPFKNECFPF